MSNNSIANLSIEQLKKALVIKEQIAALENQLRETLSGTSTAAPVAAPVAAPSRTRHMSPAVRARIAAAQRARWAKVKGAASAPALEKRTMSLAARAKIAAAQRARWARIRAQKGRK